MSRTSVRNLLVCVVQLLVTESWSVYHFCLSQRALWGEPRAWRLGLIAPISLFVLPFFALEDRSYVNFWVGVLVDAAFISLMALLIIKNHRLVNCVCLFVFNFIGVLLTVGGL